MDKNQILNQIKINRLDGCDYAFVVSQLCVLNNKPYDDVREIVDELVKQRKIKVSGAIAPNNKVKTDKSNYEKFAKRGKSKKDYRREVEVEDNYDLAYKMLERKKEKQKSYKVEGKIQSTSKGYAFLIPTDITQTDVYISERDLNGALHNDIVVANVTFSKNGKPEGKVLQVLQRGNDYVIGRITMNKNCAYVEPDDVKFGKDIYVPLSQTLRADNGDKVVVRIDRYFSGKKPPEGVVTEVLGKPNKIETEELAIIRSYKLFEDFPKKVQESASQYPIEIDKKKYPNRLDLTKELIVTIDGEDTRDIDDGVSLTTNKRGNWVLGVHIADVGEYVPRNCVLDKEAFKRGTSVYFPNRVLPMLPRELSNGICSLNERVDRLALSVLIEYDQNFKKIGYDIKESVINSKKRFTYTEVHAILMGDKEAENRNKPFVTMLKNMNKLAEKLMEQRVKAGYIEFDIPEVSISLDPLGDVLNVKRREQNESHKLIEAFMVAANEVVAEHFCKLKVPFVYRVHEAPAPEKIATFVEYAKSLGIDAGLSIDGVTPLQIQKLLKKIEKNDNRFVINKVCLRAMKKAKYTPDCMGHFGLALKYYTHFTSPIRRYPDLTIHRIIKDSINGRLHNIAELKQFVLASSVNSSDREVNAEKVERDIDDLYRVFYMRNHVGEDFEGTISGVTNFGIFVELENTVEGLVRIEDLPNDKYEYQENRFCLLGKNHSFKLGDKVKVKTLRADILSREVDFMLI